jgi:predicted transcriptional regulator
MSHTSSRSRSRRQRTTTDLLHWRRSEVVKLLSQGLTIDRTAEILQVSPATVKRDHAYIRQNSQQVLQQYFTDTLPNEVLKAIARLTAVSDEAWEMARKAKEDDEPKLRTEALRLAKDAANDITDIVTNNKALIDSARAVEDKEKRLLTEMEKMEEEEHELLSKDGGTETTESDPERVF